MRLSEKLMGVDPDVAAIITTVATGAQRINRLLEEANRQVAGSTNASGDEQLAMDLQADSIFFELFSAEKKIKEFASEERNEVVAVNPVAQYSVSIDPLDGSSLLDVNLSVGTILGIWKGGVLDGDLVAAAYVVYGPTTILVFSTGDGLHEFILRGTEFGLVQENLSIAEQGKIYSVGGLRKDWTRAHKAFVAELEEEGYKLRYSGGLVPDMHQIILKKGGIFAYPALTTKPEGKLRLLFELCPFAFLIEQAGGIATNGTKRILDVERSALHQRSAIYIGSKKEIEQAQSFFGGTNDEETE